MRRPPSRWNRGSITLAMAIAIAIAVPCTAAAQQINRFHTAVLAYGGKDYGTCVEILTAMQQAGEALPPLGDLMRVECIAASGDLPAAVEAIRMQLSRGRLDVQEMKYRDLRGLEALRNSPQWAEVRRDLDAHDATFATALDAPLREELLQREDELARWVRSLPKGGTLEQMEHMSARNTLWLKQVVADKGWPGISRVGHEGEAGLLLIVGQSTRDPQFQAEALRLMAAALDEKEVRPETFAALTDQVLRTQGKPQRYGTKFHPNLAGSYVIEPIEDLPGLEARRRALGLPTFEQYKQALSEQLGAPVK